MKTLLSALAGCVALQAPSALACAVCYGESDAPIARGMAWGMLTLLVILIGVLGSIVAFFVHLGKRSAKVASAASGAGGDSALPGRNASPSRPFPDPQAGTVAAPPEPLVESAQQV